MADIKLTNVRLSFPDLFIAKEFTAGDGKPRFNATFLVEPGSENDKAIQAAIKEAAVDTFGKKADEAIQQYKGNTNKYCYHKGDTKEYDGYEGKLYLAAHSKTHPLVIDRDRTPLTAQDSKPYAGCYVNAKVSIYAIAKGFPGIFAAFSGVQFASDGDAFSAGGPASVDEFDALDHPADDDGAGLV